MGGPEVIDHVEPRAAMSPEAVGQAAACDAWERKGRSLLLRTRAYQEAISDLAKRCGGFGFEAAKRGFDRQLAHTSKAHKASPTATAEGLAMNLLDEELDDLVRALVETIDTMAPIERSTFLATMSRHRDRVISTASLRQLRAILGPEPTEAPAIAAPKPAPAPEPVKVTSGPQKRSAAEILDDGDDIPFSFAWVALLPFAMLAMSHVA